MTRKKKSNIPQVGTWVVGSPNVRAFDAEGRELVPITATFTVSGNGNGNVKKAPPPSGYGLTAPCPGCKQKGSLVLRKRTITCRNCKCKAVFRGSGDTLP